MGKGESAEKVVWDIQRKTRRRFSAEEKIRIVLEGLRGEQSIAELCRREGLDPPPENRSGPNVREGRSEKEGVRWQASDMMRRRSSRSCVRRRSSWGGARRRARSAGNSASPRRPTIEEYGGLRTDQARRLKELERENGRLKRLVADQALDVAILKEAAKGNF